MNSLNTLTQSLRRLAIDHAAAPASRSFSSTPATASRNVKLPPRMPPYPHGPHHLFQQANSGLYGGTLIQFGNKISKGKNKGKTRRHWRPNIRVEEVHSEALGRPVKLKVQHRVLRTIQKVGGLDNYVLGDKPARIKELGVFGWKLRWRIIQTRRVQEAFRRERERLGLRPRPVTFEEFREKWMQTQIASEQAAEIESLLGKRPTDSAQLAADDAFETPEIPPQTSPVAPERA